MYRVEWIDDEGNLKIKRGFKTQNWRICGLKRCI